ncbi:clathrin [Encephalitozoon hellem]|uniref:Clathrin n=1 Tax=Encephalitozoon hellem TaxID=27973 RepID=A0ABY8CGM1_ENCHE|nr:clathrin [Encephalitozoon hellem]
MQVSYIEKQSVDELGVSTLIEDRVFFVRGMELLSKSIYTYDTEVLHKVFMDKVDYMCYFNGMLLVLCGNVLYKHKLFGKELVLSGTHQLLEPPIRIYVSGTPSEKEGYAVCFLYRNKRIDIFNDEIERVVVRCKGDVAREDEIVDFTIDDGSSWFLSKSGRIYHTHSFVVSRTVLLSRPIRMIPEPTYFDGSINKIVAKKGKMYVCYNEGFEVYDIGRDILVLNYTYRTRDFELHASSDVYCLEKNLLVVNEMPRVIASVRVHKMFGDVGISRDRILFIKKSDEDERVGTRLLKEGDADERVKRMFRITENEIKIPEIELSENGKDVSEKSFLMIQKMANDFESKVLDVYRKIYFELLTLNESFGEKMVGLSAENDLILKKVEVLDKKKNELMARLQSLSEKMGSAVARIKIDGSRMKKLAKMVEDAVDGIRFKRYERYSRVLKLQREVLNRKVV